MTHWIKATYKLDGRNIADRYFTLPPFSVGVDGCEVAITLRDGQIAESIAQTNISDALVAQLDAEEWDFDKWPNALRDEGQWFAKLPRRAFAKLNHVLKYLLRHFLLHEIAGASLPHHWSADGTSWKPFPYAFIVKGSGRATALYPDHPLHQQIQHALDRETMCFEDAFQHLHRAKHDYPRHAWINATIAAELAIKEFFVLLKPELRTLLTEVPSPPLQKLYGSVLQSLAGVESPKVKQLAKGAEIRNKLIHRPGETVDLEKAMAYVIDVEVALFHLLTLLYPDDDLIKWQYANLNQAD